jgi:hypothetical protein
MDEIFSLEGIVSKRKHSAYRSGRSPDWLKMKNANAPAVKRAYAPGSTGPLPSRLSGPARAVGAEAAREARVIFRPSRLARALASRGGRGVCAASPLSVPRAWPRQGGKDAC